MDGRNVFRFSLDPYRDADLIAFLRSIPSKNERGEWIRRAIRFYRDLEKALLYSEPPENVMSTILGCLEGKGIGGDRR